MLSKTIWAERTLPYELKQAHFDQQAYDSAKTFPSCEKLKKLKENECPCQHKRGSFSFI